MINAEDILVSSWKPESPCSQETQILTWFCHLTCFKTLGKPEHPPWSQFFKFLNNQAGNSTLCRIIRDLGNLWDPPRALESVTCTELPSQGTPPSQVKAGRGRKGSLTRVTSHE